VKRKSISVVQSHAEDSELSIRNTHKRDQTGKMGSVTQITRDYSVPQEAQKIFKNEILNNPLIPALPTEIRNAGELVSFTGAANPSIPINWRFAESAAALTAFQASMLNVLRIRKYKDQCQLSKVDIDTDHASLFFMSPFLAKVVESGEAKPWPFSQPQVTEKYGFKNTDLHHSSASMQRVLATNIYKTKDGRFYHVHGSMNPEPTLTALGMHLEGAADEKYEDVAARFQDVVGKLNSAELDTLMNDKYRQAGTIAYTAEEFWKTEHGKANAHVGLYELQKSERHSQPASWWLENEGLPSSPQRPLAGLKVVDLTRVIAAPTIVSTVPARNLRFAKMLTLTFS
jgi:crotonobetainyl-CoA:carnitine CoA-transferase CaiB-like acyl-CoA transferase